MRERVRVSERDCEREWECEKHGGEDGTTKRVELLFLSSVFVPQEEAVRFRHPRMAQPHIAFAAKPGRVGALVSNLEAACTTSSLASCSGVVLNLEREVHQGERANSTTTSTSPSTTAIVPDQLFCQSKPELLEGHPSCRAEVLPQDVSICYANIKKKVKDVLIELSALCAAVVVAAQLITSINTTHVGIVG